MAGDPNENVVPPPLDERSRDLLVLGVRGARPAHVADPAHPDDTPDLVGQLTRLTQRGLAPGVRQQGMEAGVRVEPPVHVAGGSGPARRVKLPSPGPLSRRETGGCHGHRETLQQDAADVEPVQLAGVERCPAQPEGGDHGGR